MASLFHVRRRFSETPGEQIKDPRLDSSHHRSYLHSSQCPFQQSNNDMIEQTLSLRHLLYRRPRHPTMREPLIAIALGLCLGCSPGLGWSTQLFPSASPARPPLVRTTTRTSRRSADTAAAATACSTPPQHTSRSSTTSTNTATCSRKTFFLETLLLTMIPWTAPAPAFARSSSASSCTDIETCREIGERRDAENLAQNPITRLGDGLQFKVLAAGIGPDNVQPDSRIQIIYSVSQANGSYMFSRGMGYNKININNNNQQQVSDFGLDSLSVTMGSTATIPVGVQRALLGAKRGERRRIQCPPRLGFETSDWNPKPTTFRGERQMIDYRSTLTGSSGGLAFPAPTIWDVEVVSIR